MKRKTKVEKMKQRTIKRGRMLNIDQIIKAQGGHESASAVAGAYAIAEYAMKKAAVEPGWVEVDPSSRRMTFRMIERGTGQGHSKT
eukprot:7511079-Pyramimonas_sp.AAC.1